MTRFFHGLLGSSREGRGERLYIDSLRTSHILHTQICMIIIIIIIGQTSVGHWRAFFKYIYISCIAEKDGGGEAI